MTQQNLDFGTGTPNDGEFLSTAFLKIQENFDEIYAALSGEFSNLFLATGAVINFHSGDVTITHAANTLTFAGASSGYFFDALVQSSVAGNAARFVNTTDASGSEVLRLEGDRATPADFDSANVGLYLSDSAGTQKNVATLGWQATDVTAGTNVDGLFFIGVMAAGVANAKLLIYDGLSLTTYANDEMTLGTTSSKIADIFLASGAVVNFDSGDVTITHGSNALTIAGGSLGIGVAPTLPLTLIGGAEFGANGYDPGLEIWTDDGVTAANLDVTGYGALGGGIIHFRYARGTRTAPTAAQSGDAVGGIGARVYHSGGAFQTSSPAAIHWTAAENQTGGAYGMYMTFLTTPIGSTTRAERMRIDDAGLLSIGTTTGITTLTVSNATNLAGTFKNTAASGSSAGSFVQVISDDGAALASGDLCGAYSFGGSVDASHTIARGAAIKAFTAEAWNSGALGTYLTIETASIGSASRTERVRIDSTGLVTLAAGQIKFPASDNPSSDANTLDDYQEGTWSPTITTTGTVGTPAYSVQVGSYEKIGRQVTLRFNITLSGWTGSPTGNVNIGNLPFPNTATANDQGVAIIPNYIVTGLAALNYGVGGVIAASASAIILTQFGSTATSAITAAQVGATPTFNGSAVYYV